MSSPNFNFEKKLWKKELKFVAGADEVGRGCFAGPVVAACVVFQKGDPLKNQGAPLIDDSKKLTKLQRENAEEWIKINAAVWGIGEVSAKVINRVGMGLATKMAFRQAASSANKKFEGKIEYLLVDYFYIPYLKHFPRSRQLAIVKGDELSFSIAAASIVAKVYRDNLMEKIGSRPIYKKYDWGSNKGYATRYHRDAILKHGITGYHRRQFVKTFLKNQ